MLKDSGKFFKALGLFARGMAMITGRGPSGKPGGGTANGFARVFLDPPLIQILLANFTRCLSAFYAAKRIAGHVDNA